MGKFVRPLARLTTQSATSILAAEELALRIGVAAVIGIWRKEALEVSDGLTSSQSSKWNREVETHLPYTPNQ